jgi:type II secretory pathway component PulF
MTKNWQYRAINRNLQIQEGILQATSFIQLAVALRQQGLQIIEAQQIGDEQLLVSTRLNMMKQRLNYSPPQDISSNTSTWWKRFINWFS